MVCHQGFVILGLWSFTSGKGGLGQFGKVSGGLVYEKKIRTVTKYAGG